MSAADDLVAANQDDAQSKLERAGHLIAESVHAAGGRLAGSELGSVLLSRGIRYADYGFENLSALIEAVSPSIHRVGARGGDVIWGDESQGLGDRPAERGELWRALASPNSSKRVPVFVNRQTGEFRISPSGKISTLDGASDWIRINPVSVAELRDAAADFVETVPDPRLRSSLQLALAGEGWWATWMTQFRAWPQIGLNWIEAKATTVRDSLERQLRDAELPPIALERALGYPASVPLPRSSKRPVSQHGGHAAGKSAPTIQSLLADMAPRMTEHEIRNMSVTLGAVWDYLRDQG